jgi:hypothetical protein
MDFHTFRGPEEEEELVLGVRGARAGCEVRPCRKEVMAVRSESSRNLEWKVRSQLVREEMLPSVMGVEERQTKLE